jgi:hypothetical protein
MDSLDSLLEIVARYTDAQLVEARDSIARWDAEAEMPAALVTLSKIINDEIAFRKVEDAALQEGAR